MFWLVLPFLLFLYLYLPFSFHFFIIHVPSFTFTNPFLQSKTLSTPLKMKHSSSIRHQNEIQSPKCKHKVALLGKIVFPMLLFLLILAKTPFRSIRFYLNLIFTPSNFIQVHDNFKICQFHCFFPSTTKRNCMTLKNK